MRVVLLAHNQILRDRQCYLGDTRVAALVSEPGKEHNQNHQEHLYFQAGRIELVPVWERAQRMVEVAMALGEQVQGCMLVWEGKQGHSRILRDQQWYLLGSWVEEVQDEEQGEAGYKLV